MAYTMKDAGMIAMAIFVRWMDAFMFLAIKSHVLCYFLSNMVVNRIVNDRISEGLRISFNRFLCHLKDFNNSLSQNSSLHRVKVFQQCLNHLLISLVFHFFSVWLRHPEGCFEHSAHHQLT